MKDIKFETLTIRNFKSVGDREIVINFKEGINFITGYNYDKDSYNGVGKTSIIEAFFYVLFGATFRKINKSNLINDKTNGVSELSLTFKVNDDEYFILRSLNPSKVIFTKNGIDITKTIPETNKDICELIEGDIEIYSNSVVMDAGSKGFITKEAAKRVSFIEQILSLGVFADMLKDAKSEVTEKNKQIAKVDGSLSQLRSMVEFHTSNSEKFEVARQSSIKNLEDSLLEFKTVATVDDKSESIKKAEDDLATIDSRIKEINTKINKINIKVVESNSNVSKEKDKLKNLKSLICGECLRPLDGHSGDDITKREEQIKSSLSSFMEVLKKNKEDYTKADDILQKLEGFKSKTNKNLIQLKKDQIEYENTSNKIKEEQFKIDQIKYKIEQEIQKDNPHNSSLIELNPKLEIEELNSSKLREELAILDVVKYLCSPEGVKSVIISDIITLFNSKLDYYLKRLEAPCTIEFDSSFECMIKNELGREISYYNLSGGESKRVDIALIFTFRDLRRLQSSVNINVSMFDELFDSALDSVGISKILEILEEQALSNNECIYMVTHRKDDIEDKNYNVVLLEKRDGITQCL